MTALDKLIEVVDETIDCLDYDCTIELLEAHIKLLAIARTAYELELQKSAKVQIRGDQSGNGPDC